MATELQLRPISKSVKTMSTEKKYQIHEDLTIEKLRTYEGFENISEEKAVEDIKVIKTVARALYDIYLQINQKRETR